MRNETDITMRSRRACIAALGGLALAGSGLAGCSHEDTLTNPVHDVLLPRVDITQPARGAALDPGTVTLRATASDNAGVARVEFYDGTTMVGADSIAAGQDYEIAWNAMDGRHLLAAKAFDVNGNAATDTLSVTCGAFSTPTSHAGPITVSETWDTTGNPHIINGDIDISSDAADDNPVVTILPGCIVQFDDHYSIVCSNGGSIVANGTAESPIIFTTTGSVVSGAWGQVAIRADAGSGASIAHGIFQYGGGGGVNAVIDVEGTAAITDCSLNGSASAGIHLGAAAQLTAFTGNTITGAATAPVEAAGPAPIGDLGTGNTLVANGSNTIRIDAGTVEHSATWVNQGVPYVLAGSLEVEGGASPVLTINPGCRIEFAFGSELGCGGAAPGAIVVGGTPDSLVVLSQAGVGGWQGVGVHSQATAETRFQHCVIESAGFMGTAAALRLEAPATVLGTTVSHGGGDGVEIAGGAAPLAFSGNTVANCGGRAVVIAEPDDVKGLGLGNAYTANAVNVIDVQPGTGFVTASATWQNQGIPYVFHGDVGVSDPAGPVVTIAPGTTLMMDGELYVGYPDFGPGGLVADGTAQAITFTSSSVSPVPGDWKGVSFYGATIDASARLMNCTVEYGGRQSEGRGNVYIADAMPVVSGCTIQRSSGYGIDLSGAHPSQESLAAANTFSDNALGDIHQGVGP